VDAGTSKTAEHTELTYKGGETYRDWIAVEVRSPHPAESGGVSFSVTCEEAPGDGASSYAAAAAALRQSARSGRRSQATAVRPLQPGR
jgi:hypothetical protein